MTTTEPTFSRPASKRGRLQRALHQLLQAHDDRGELPTSGRFLWYELVQAGTVDKTEARGHPGIHRGIDQDVTDALIYLREQNIIPWDWIVDETRHLYEYTGHPTIRGGLRDVLDQIDLDPWDGQPPLIITESRSLAGALDSLAQTYRCTITATNGQVGGFLHTEVVPLLWPGRRVLYCGDWDLSGHQIEANTRRVLQTYAPLRWERLALTKAQVDTYDLRRLLIMQIDRRHTKRGCCPPGHPKIETEALQQGVIVAIVRARLDRFLPEELAAVLVRERRQRAAMAAALDRLEV